MFCFGTQQNSQKPDTIDFEKHIYLNVIFNENGEQNNLEGVFRFSYTTYGPRVTKQLAKAL